MKTEWFSHLKTPEQQKLQKESVLASQIVLDRLKEVCYNKIKSGTSTLISLDDPNWALKQADKVGEIRGLEYVISLLTFKEA